MVRKENVRDSRDGKVLVKISFIMVLEIDGYQEVKKKVIGNEEARKVKCQGFRWITCMNAQGIMRRRH